MAIAYTSLQELVANYSAVWAVFGRRHKNRFKERDAVTMAHCLFGEDSRDVYDVFTYGAFRYARRCLRLPLRKKGWPAEPTPLLLATAVVDSCGRRLLDGALSWGSEIEYDSKWKAFNNAPRERAGVPPTPMELAWIGKAIKEGKEPLLPRFMPLMLRNPSESEGLSDMVRTGGFVSGLSVGFSFDTAEHTRRLPFIIRGRASIEISLMFQELDA